MENDVLTLKQAWEIKPSEIKLGRRIDGESTRAFGEVWDAVWDTIPVAVKMLQKSVINFDEHGVCEEFQREIEIMQRTRHPNIVRFFGAGTWTDGTPFFVLELMSRGSLKTLLRGKAVTESLPAAVKLSFALDIAKGMEYIHSQGHIHRDLKSGNVLISETMRAKIADFGTMRRICRGLYPTRARAPSVQVHTARLRPTSTSQSPRALPFTWHRK